MVIKFPGLYSSSYRRKQLKSLWWNNYLGISPYGRCLFQLLASFEMASSSEQGGKRTRQGETRGAGKHGMQIEKPTANITKGKQVRNFLWLGVQKAFSQGRAIPPKSKCRCTMKLQLDLFILLLFSFLQAIPISLRAEIVTSPWLKYCRSPRDQVNVFCGLPSGHSWWGVT